MGGACFSLPGERSSPTTEFFRGMELSVTATPNAGERFQKTIQAAV
jgi:hypothetical protein